MTNRIIIPLAAILGLAACSDGITDKYILTIEGLCSLGNYDANRELSVTCKTGPNSYKKNFLGLSDNVTYFAEQIDGAGVDIYRYRVFFKPAAIVPDINLLN